MKKIILLLILPFLWSFSYGQKKTEAEKLVEEGIGLHDSGNYKGAIAKYDKALKLDTDNPWALTEKGVTLLSLQDYDEAITISRKAIATHPGNKILATVYVTYGNSLDALKKPDKAIAIYDEGIQQFPDYYQLYFNKGISLINLGNFDEGMVYLQKAILLNPNHAGSHNAIARIAHISKKRIPALLAYWRFLSLEPEGNRASENLKSILNLMAENVAQPSKDSITVHYDPDMFGDTTQNGTPSENNFITTDLIVSMDASRDFIKEFKYKTEVEKFMRKLETVCSSLKETRKDNSGFFWEYYAPYFIEMKEKNFVETYSYFAFLSSEDPAIVKWLNAHTEEMEKFLKWSAAFEWKK